MHVLEQTLTNRTFGFEPQEMSRELLYNLGILPPKSHTDTEIYRWFMKVNYRRQKLDCFEIAANACCRRNPKDRSANRLACWLGAIDKRVL